MRIAPGLFCFFYSDQPQNFCMKKTRLNLTVRNDEGKSMGWSSKPWQLCHCWLGTPRTLRRQQVCSDGQPRPGRARNVSLLCQALDHHRPGDGGSKKQKSHGAFQRPLDWNCRWAIKKGLEGGSKVMRTVIEMLGVLLFYYGFVVPSGIDGVTLLQNPKHVDSIWVFVVFFCVHLSRLALFFLHLENILCDS